MKKLLTLFCAAALCTTGYAGKIEHWNFFMPGTLLVPNNFGKTTTMKFMVNSQFERNGDEYTSDKVYFTCNDKITGPMPTDTWVVCKTEPNQNGGVILSKNNLKNGAVGLYEVVD